MGLPANVPVLFPLLVMAMVGGSAVLQAVSVKLELGTPVAVKVKLLA